MRLAPKQRRVLDECLEESEIGIENFEFSHDEENELKLIYKPAQIHFRVVVKPSARSFIPAQTYVYYTPDNRSLIVDYEKELFHEVRTWERVEGSLKEWLAWIYVEYDHSTSARKSTNNLLDNVSRPPALGTSEPRLSHLHPVVQQAASSRFASAHYSDSIEKACIALEKAVRDKANQPSDLGGVDLMNRVFSQASPVITLSSDRGEREGYMFLFRGMWQSLRNHHAHNDTSTDPARALEWLSFISALLYKLDEAAPLTSTTP